eukprot:TRINITY_DN32091_c0_g1_i1.p1 TRINITY_DN32091_c0_g1~~TRINITY_DN32091_c0_g1_i1.p1  ORF type:complete len:580 (+),score=153.57 TRINITY_DN32091_c0_g1_i1:159-1898(+)
MAWENMWTRGMDVWPRWRAGLVGRQPSRRRNLPLAATLATVIAAVLGGLGAELCLFLGGRSGRGRVRHSYTILETLKPVVYPALAAGSKGDADTLSQMADDLDALLADLFSGASSSKPVRTSLSEAATAAASKASSIPRTSGADRLSQMADDLDELTATMSSSADGFSYPRSAPAASAAASQTTDFRPSPVAPAAPSAPAAAEVPSQVAEARTLHATPAAASVNAQTVHARTSPGSQAATGVPLQGAEARPSPAPFPVAGVPLQSALPSASPVASAPAGVPLQAAGTMVSPSMLAAEVPFASARVPLQAAEARASPTTPATEVPLQAAQRGASESQTEMGLQIQAMALRRAPIEFGANTYIATMEQIEQMMEQKIQTFKASFMAMKRYAEELEAELERREEQLEQSQAQLEEEQRQRIAAEADRDAFQKRQESLEAKLVNDSQDRRDAEQRVKMIDLKAEEVAKRVSAGELSEEEAERIEEELIRAQAERLAAQQNFQRNEQELTQVASAAEEAERRARTAEAAEQKLRQELESLQGALQQVQEERDAEAARREQADGRFQSLVQRLQAKKASSQGESA